jgi:hypothetical protein
MESSALTIPNGRYTLAAALDDRLRALTQAPPRGPDGAAHPAFAFVIALGGMGLRIAAVSDRLGLAFGAGPVLAACRIDTHAALRVGRDYDVGARVESLERKPSRRFGAADHLRLHIELRHAGTLCAETRLHIIFPSPILPEPETP